MLSPHPELLQRGIWRAPYLVAGLPVLIAVDRHGVVRKHHKLGPGVDELAAAAALERLLDRLDPLPQLRLVRPAAPAPPRPIDPACYRDARHPCHADDYHAYRRRLARQLAGNLRLFRD